MKVEQALELLSRVVAQYRGTLEEHQMLQQAMQTIQSALAKNQQSVKQSKVRK